MPAGGLVISTVARVPLGVSKVTAPTVSCRGWRRAACRSLAGAVLAMLVGCGMAVAAPTPSLVKDIAAADGVGSQPVRLTGFGSVALFVADDGASGAELWRSYGTSMSTERVAVIAAGSVGSSPEWLTVVERPAGHRRTKTGYRASGVR